MPGTPIYLYQKFAIGDVPKPNNVFRPVRVYYQPALISQAALTGQFII
jgi:hypothetical protein